MKLNFNREQGLNVPSKLLNIINVAISKSNYSVDKASAITLNFRDESYSAQTGGYHPVEIRLEKQLNQLGIPHWQLIYITDFSCQGRSFPELVKEIDVCFIRKCIFSLYDGWLNKRSGTELLKIFIDNFIDYYHMEAFTTSISIEE